jgi:hypothetical protein
MATAAETKLANAGRDQLAPLLPLADSGDSRNVKVNVRHSLVVLRDRIYEHAERLIDRWVIAAAGAGKMRDLNRNARRRGAEPPSETRDAAGTDAPDGSITRPVTSAVVVCENASGPSELIAMLNNAQRQVVGLMFKNSNRGRVHNRTTNL